MARDEEDPLLFKFTVLMILKVIVMKRIWPVPILDPITLNVNNFYAKSVPISPPRNQLSTQMIAAVQSIATPVITSRYKV